MGWRANEKRWDEPATVHIHKREIKENGWQETETGMQETAH